MKLLKNLNQLLKEMKIRVKVYTLNLLLMNLQNGSIKLRKCIVRLWIRKTLIPLDDYLLENV